MSLSSAQQNVPKETVQSKAIAEKWVAHFFILSTTKTISHLNLNRIFIDSLDLFTKQTPHRAKYKKKQKYYLKNYENKTKPHSARRIDGEKLYFIYNTFDLNVCTFPLDCCDWEINSNGNSNLISNSSKESSIFVSLLRNRLSDVKINSL